MAVEVSASIASGAIERISRLPIFSTETPAEPRLRYVVVSLPMGNKSLYENSGAMVILL